VFVFYLTFASTRVAVIALKAGLEIGLACLNHFPLFAVMLRIKDSRRLPGKFLKVVYVCSGADNLGGGIYFELHDARVDKTHSSDDLGSLPTAYINLKVCWY
jgi:phosphatidylinositol glycan class Q protein